MQLDVMLQVATMLLAAGSAASPTMRTSQLAKEFPKQYDDRNAVVEQVTVEYPNFDALFLPGVPLVNKESVTVVTITDGDAFCRLLDLSRGNAFIANMTLTVPWCEYRGSDHLYHYMQGFHHPEEIYRVRRTLLEDEKLWRAFQASDMESRIQTAVGVFPSDAAGFYLSRANLDRSMFQPFAAEDDIWVDLGMPVGEPAAK